MFYMSDLEIMYEKSSTEYALWILPTQMKFP